MFYKNQFAMTLTVEERGSDMKNMLDRLFGTGERSDSEFLMAEQQFAEYRVELYMTMNKETQ